MRKGPPGPLMVCSPTAAMSAGGAITAMRASYWTRATSIVRVCVAGTPVPLSSSAWIWGSTGIVSRYRPALLCRACQRCRPGRQEAVEHLPRTFVELLVNRAVEYPYAVDEYPVHAERIAEGTRPAAGQVIDSARCRDADGRGIEQQQIGTSADRDAAAVGDAIKPGLMAGQAARPFGEIERATLAHPIAEKVEPEPGVAQIDEVRAGIGQRDHPCLVLDQRLDPGVYRIEEASDKAGVEIFVEAEIKQ